MKFSVALAAALFLPVLVNAQYNYPPDTTSSTDTETYPESTTTPMASGASSTAPASTSTAAAVPASNSTNISVQVAAGGNLVYNPANFTAANGTIVTFFFPSGSFAHSVTQGSFADPCVYLAASGADPAGFDSGLQSGGKEFTLKIVNDQEPVWFFCKNADHCGLGMVGAINAPSTGNTYDAWLAAAKALGSNEKPLSDTGPVTGGVGAVATGTPVPSAAAAATSPGTTSTPSKTPSSSSRLVANGFFALLATVFGVTLA